MSIVPHFPGNRLGGVFDPYSTDMWDPFIDSSNRGMSMSHCDPSSAFVNAHIDWRETPEAHIFKADLPAMRKEEVKLELEEDRLLLISGERSREQEESNDMWHRVEGSSGKFMRRFRLPENVKMDQIKASMELLSLL